MNAKRIQFLWVKFLTERPRLRTKFNILMCRIALVCVRVTCMETLLGHSERRGAIHMIQNLLQANGVKGARE